MSKVSPPLPNSSNEATFYEVVDLLRERERRGTIRVWAWATLKRGAWVELDYAAAINWAIDVARFNDGKVSYRINGEGILFLGCGECLETWTTPR